MYLEKDLVFFDIETKSREELFLKIEEFLVEKKYAIKGLGQALIDREKEYPTGLALKGINIAIAHADPKYSLDNKICAIKPQDKIVFQNIENLEKLNIDLIFILLLKDSGNHLNILRTISSVFLDDDFIAAVKETKNSQELFQVLDNYINNVDSIK
ncbi:PTS sugar transporter subunit IIA [Maledivibacter halophilus]|uniref:PTS system, galactitol-specific IIA component n=1 Tax=Maledivibacter halophilus TaxID=36842 RepID=A0A1T5L0G1_9FIRM|nr:PTS sugar transporter subunit IIA [Maledivibacter halophilus]SKC69507.1 PTS system, galactitol-specific IIA component [Maledivibacter halophilus]